MSPDPPQPNLRPEPGGLPYTPKFWALVTAAGLTAGVAGGLLMRLLRIIQHAAFGYSEGDFFTGASAAAPGRRMLMLVAAGIVAALVAHFAPKLIRPTPVGLNGAIWFRSGHVPFVPTLVYALESIVIVGMGVALGREGALKDTGGAIASKLSDWFKLPDDQRRVLVACAAGAGMASAYNIPLGGSLFAAEVLLGSLSLSAVLPALATSLLATATSWPFLTNQPAYKVPFYAFQVTDLVWAALVAPIFGLAAVAWVRSIGLAERRRLNRWQESMAPIAVFLALGVVAIWFPDVLGNGKGLVQRTFVGMFDIQTLSALLILRCLATLFCVASGAPGGLFTPTMASGALLGGVLGRLFGLVVHGSDIGVFAEIGSTTLLAVSTRGPVSSIVMVMELTHHMDSIMVPLLICVVGASLVAGRFEQRSIYTAAIRHAEADK